MDGGERVVDLGEVNGRVFVNNVSLGVYAEAVQHERYRSAKLRTLLETLPVSLGARGASQDLPWVTPGGRTLHGATVVLVANNKYRLSGAAGAGTRPAIDQGNLGVTVVDPPLAREKRRRRPVRFRSRPGALRVRIAAPHPGASPSSVEPVGALAALRALVRIAAGRDPVRLTPEVGASSGAVC